VEPRLEELRPSPGERRLNHGWRLARAAFSLLRAQRSLLALTLLLAILASADAVLGLWIGIARPFNGSENWLGRLLLVGVEWTLANYLLVAVASSVDAALGGVRLETRDALAEAGECAGPIVGWTAIETAFILASWLVGRAIGAPWVPIPAAFLGFFATLFVVPMLAVERVGAGEAIGESLVVIRDRWRQAFGGLVGIGFFAGVAVWVAGAILRHAAALNREGHGKQYALGIAGLALAASAGAVAIAGREAFATLLLRDGFDELPGHPPVGPPRSRQSRLLRGAAVFVFIVIAFAALGAWSKHDERTLTASQAPGSNYFLIVDDPQAVTISGGAPVMYGHREVGTVLGSQLEDEKLKVSFHVEPGIGPATAPAVAQVAEGVVSGPYLELLPAAGGGVEAQPL
jgi:hypothetical protein